MARFALVRLVVSFLVCPIFVVNRAQRCEFHKLAVFLVGGGGSVVLCAELMLVAILVKYESARNFERAGKGSHGCPPSLRKMEQQEG